MIPELTRTLFEGFVGHTFKVTANSGETVDLKLVKVAEAAEKNCKDQLGNVRTETFSVFFEGEPQGALPQGLATFRHDEMGDVELFVVPIVAPRPNTRGYEVAINRLLTA